MMISRIGLARAKQQRDQRAEAEEPHPRRHRRHRAAAVERHDRQQVEEVEEEARRRRARARKSLLRQLARPPGNARRRACRASGPASPTRASASALSPSDARRDHGAQERDEHRRARPDALACAARSRGPSRGRTAAPRSPPRTPSPRTGCTRRPTPARCPRCVSSLSFGSSSRQPLIAAKNFAISATIAASALPMRLRSAALAGPRGRLLGRTASSGARVRGVPRRGRSGQRGGAGERGARGARSGKSPSSMHPLWQLHKRWLAPARRPASRLSRIFLGRCGMRRRAALACAPAPG